MKSEEEQDNQNEIAPENTSALSKKITKLKDTVLTAAAKREHLPQPLFWSLFHAELQKIKQERTTKRLLEEILG